MPKFSNKSKSKLATCDELLQKLFNKIITEYDCIILEGHRCPTRQLELYEAGKSKVKKGKHNFTPSLAIDIPPFPIPKNWGEKNIKELAKFYHFAGFVLATANELQIPIRWGGDWDCDKNFTDQTFDDLVHFELT